MLRVRRCRLLLSDAGPRGLMPAMISGPAAYRNRRADIHRKIQQLAASTQKTRPIRTCEGAAMRERRRGIGNPFAVSIPALVVRRIDEGREIRPAAAKLRRRRWHPEWF